VRIVVESLMPILIILLSELIDILQNVGGDKTLKEYLFMVDADPTYHFASKPWLQLSIIRPVAELIYLSLWRDL